jgi:hypothetical protein
MSAILSALLGTSSSSTSEPVMDTPVISSSTAKRVAKPVSDTPSTDESSSDSSVITEPVSDTPSTDESSTVAKPVSDTPRITEPVTEPKKSIINGSFVTMYSDGKFSNEEKVFETFDDFAKFFSAFTGQSTSAVKSTDSQDSSKEDSKANSADSAKPTSDAYKNVYKYFNKDVNKDANKDANKDVNKDAKSDEFSQLLDILMGEFRHSCVDPNNPATFCQLPAVGDSKPHETFIPLLHRDVSFCNPLPPNGMSTEFYAKQYCDISTDASAATLDLTNWVNMDLLKSLIQTTSQKTSTAPEARVHVLPGTYVRNRTTRQNVVASVFLRRLQMWLGDQFGQDATWKRVVVFDADLLGYTVCF